MAVFSIHAQSLNPTGSITVHDPVLIKEGNTYYCFHSGPRVGVKTSTNLIDWVNTGSALPSPVPAWWSQLLPKRSGGDTIWAPDISYRNNTYWLYYAITSYGSQVSAIGLATRSSLSAGSWTDRGTVITSSTFSVNDNAIDPNIITDTQGSVWMVWGSWWDGIFIVRLDPQTGKPQSGVQPVHVAGRNLSGKNEKGIEGAFIVYARGYYHLFTSWDLCCLGTRSNYNIRYGRSASVTGPYVDKAGVQLLAGGGTLLSDGSGHAGGHNAVFYENGNYYLVYHVYDGRDNISGFSASLQIRRLFFDAQNWPTLDSAKAVAVRPYFRRAGSRLFHSPLHDLLGRSRKATGGAFRGCVAAELPDAKPKP